MRRPESRRSVEKPAAQYSCVHDSATTAAEGDGPLRSRRQNGLPPGRGRTHDMKNRMSSGNRHYPFAAAFVLLLYAGVRLITAPPILEKPRIQADTASYVRISGESIARIDFWAGARPAGFPLLLKISAQDYSRAAALQLGISILAWGVLAWMVSRFLGRWGLQFAGLALILLFSLDRHIASWDFVMMSESLSISSLALFISASLWLLRGWNAWKVVAFSCAALLLAFTRDTNAWMLLALAVLIGAAALLRWMAVRSLIPAGCLVVIFLLSNAAATYAERWGFPLGNLIAQRVLANTSALAYFQSCGMPVSPALMQLTGKYANSDEQAMFAGPELDSFRYWLRDHGKGCYVGWLLENPVPSIQETLSETGGLIAFPTVDRFFSNRYASLLPAQVAGALYPERLTLWIWAYSTLAALIIIWKKRWRDNALWAAFVCMTLLIFPHLYLTWHGDAMAPDRHALSVGVQLYLAFWMLNLLLIEFVWSRLRHQALRPSQSAGQT